MQQYIHYIYGMEATSPPSQRVQVPGDSLFHIEQRRLLSYTLIYISLFITNMYIYMCAYRLYYSRAQFEI